MDQRLAHESHPPELALDPDELRMRMKRVRWFHSMDLGHGLRTNGRYDPVLELPRYGIPRKLEGRTVLDVGAWDGFYSFECERRGADRVLATDSYSWSGDNNMGSKAGFDLAHAAYQSSVDSQVIDVLDLSPDALGGTFDLVLFLGVLYHMRHPLLALERVASVTSSQLILETAVDQLWTRRPSAAFYPQWELANDPTNWWGPNHRAVVAMLRDVGFARVTVHWSYPLWRRAGRAVKRWREEDLPLFTGVQQGRTVFHAWR